MTEEEKKAFRSLTDKYGLGKNDFHFNAQGWTIITRRGIEKIQMSMGLHVRYVIIPELTSLEKNAIVIKAIATNQETQIESYGEANQNNVRGQAGKFMVAMAEKRALSRVVLKASLLYQLDGVYGEDEIADHEDGKTTTGAEKLQRVARTSVSRKK